MLYCSAIDWDFVVLHILTGISEVNIDLQAEVLVQIRITYLPVSKLYILVKMICFKAIEVALFAGNIVD
jgi:hypothetical protein